MGLIKLDGHTLKLFFYSGMLHVHQNKKYMNDINVFPVADGDTGTNLSVTLRAMVEKSNASDSFSDTAKSISQSGLAHARGNSGIIFVSFINGLALESNQLQSVTVKEFAQIATKAADYAYQAVERPTEGTMISVMRDWSNYLLEHHMRFETFNELLSEALLFAEKSLEKTTSMLEVLRKNKVVDAGAAGFVGFLKGIDSFLKNQIPAAQVYQDPPTLIETQGGSQFRYCTEAFLTDVNVSNKTITEQIARLGDSLIVTAIGNQLRVHLHTDTPSELFKRLRPYGKLVEQKIEDMRLQESVKHNLKSSIGILTDSIGDLPDDFKLKYQIHTLPLSLFVDDVTYLDKLSITLPDALELMKDANPYPTSSLPSPLMIEEKLKELMEIYEYVLVVTVSSQLSGTYQVISRVAKEVDPTGKKIVVIDSLTNSGAQGLIVREAALLTEQGLEFDAIVNAIQEIIQKTKIFVCLESISYAIKSGRVPKTLGGFAMALGARPIMTVDQQGRGSAFGVGFSQKQMTRQIMKLVSKRAKENQIITYSIVHAGNPELADDYVRRLKAILGMPPVFITEISSVTAIHSGIGSVAVSFIER